MKEEGRSHIAECGVEREEIGGQLIRRSVFRDYNETIVHKAIRAELGRAPEQSVDNSAS